MGLGIYVHIPFCLKKCNYCDFNSSDKLGSLKKIYKDAVICEIENSPYNSADSVFIGGGTPTSMETSDLIEIINAVRDKFNVKAAEFTVEVNPATLDYQGFCMLKGAGVNRLSIGLQSAVDEELKTLGRIHTFEQFKNTWQSARRAGFDNINIDLMFSLPNQTFDSWQYTLSEIFKLNPEHLSCYSLIIEEGTPFWDMELNLPDEETDRRMYSYAVETLKSNGFDHYEISNFAKKNKRCKHNIKYWKRKNYAGFGAGASSLIDNIRYKNTEDIETYIKNNVLNRDVLEKNDIISEYIFLRLRMTEGIDLEHFKDCFGYDLYQSKKTEIDEYVSLGLMEISGRLKLTLTGISVSNQIMSTLI